MKTLKVNVGDGYEYLFTDKECIILEKYFDSIRLFMKDDTVEKVSGDYDKVELIARYDCYLMQTDYNAELEFSELMFNEFGVLI